MTVVEEVEVTDDSDSDSDSSSSLSNGSEAKEEGKEEEEDDDDDENKEEEEKEKEKEKKLSKKEKRLKRLKKKKKKKMKDLFQFSICGMTFPVYFDRVFLENLFDRNNSIWEILFCLILGVSTALSEVYLIYHMVYFLEKIFVCFVASTCYITLLRSPQPDGNSFSHFSILNSFSRAFFFSIFSGVYILQIEFNLKYDELPLYLIITLPFICFFGVVPNCNTFFIYIFEFIHMNLLGGTGFTSMIGVFCFITIDCIIIGVLVLALYLLPFKELDFLKEILFIFCVIFLGFIFSVISSNYFLQFPWPLSELKKIKKEDIKLMYVGRVIINVVTGVLFGLAGVLFLLFYVEIYYVFPVLLVLGFINHWVLVQLKRFHPFYVLKRPFEFMEKRSVKKLFSFIKFILKYVEIITWIFLISQNCLLLRNLVPTYQLFNNIIISVYTFKMVVLAFMNRSKLYHILFFAVLYYYFEGNQDLNLIFLCFMFSLVIDRVEEFFEKSKFFLIYRNVKSISAIYHLILYPLSFPHLSLFIFCVLYSVLTSCPVIPWLGSNLWILSYPRPVKFWEKSYKTKRRDLKSMTFSQSLISGGGSENFGNNLNSVFYEHLVTALKKCKNIFEYFGNLRTGDMFIILNDDLTALIHFVEVGHDFVTFQLRGLEFAGTVCQEKEQEALLNSVNLDGNEDNYGICGERFLSVKGFMEKNFYYSWYVMSKDFSLDTYKRIENKVDLMVNTFDNKRLIFTYYMYTIIYFVVEDEKLDDWIKTVDEWVDNITKVNDGFVDHDVYFSSRTDCDFDENVDGVSFKEFKKKFEPFINLCMDNKEKLKQAKLSKKKKENKTITKEEEENVSKYTNEEKEKVTKFAFLLTLAARRSLYSVPEFDQSLRNNVLFVENIFRNFTLDFNIMKDLWVFNDTNLLDLFSKSLIMALRLFQDSFISFSEITQEKEMYEIVKKYDEGIQMCAEKDEQWKTGITKDQSRHLFTLRKIIDPSNTEPPKYLFLTLTRERRKFNIIKLNKYSVRSIWASQQNELIFFKNQNKERGSIQQFKHVLRNIVITLMDIPIGYCCYISPLTTSYQGVFG